jgi:hypothetical protein
MRSFNLLCNLLITVFSLLKLYQKEQKLLFTKGRRRPQILAEILVKDFNYKLKLSCWHFGDSQKTKSCFDIDILETVEN